jgi:hypothetical protein
MLEVRNGINCKGFLLYSGISVMLFLNDEFGVFCNEE